MIYWTLLGLALNIGALLYVVQVVYPRFKDMVELATMIYYHETTDYHFKTFWTEYCNELGWKRFFLPKELTKNIFENAINVIYGDEIKERKIKDLEAVLEHLIEMENYEGASAINNDILILKQQL